MSTTEQQAKPYLGRCKECDYALYVTPDQVRPGENWKSVTAGTGPYRIPNYGVYARCPNRHKVFVLREVKGTYNPNRPCDARCMNAKGHDCSCACGGVNHGRGHALQIQTVATVTPEQADRKRGHVTAESAPATDNQLDYIRSLSERLGIMIPYDETPTREGASRLINDLKARVMEQRRPPADPATPKQMSYINALMEERSMALEARREARRQFDAGLTKAQARRWIERLKELPKIEAKA